MKPICLDFIKPLVGDYMRNCVLSVPKIKQVIQRLMLKLYESTCRIYPSISPFPYKLFSKVRKHLLLTSRIVQPADTQGQHITLQYPKTLSYRGFFLFDAITIAKPKAGQLRKNTPPRVLL